MSGYEVFASLTEFYRVADPRLREFSPEVDYGVRWTDPPGPRQGSRAWPYWRVSWIEASGEVYTVCQMGSRDRCPVRLYGVAEGREAAEALLAGWVDHCEEPGSLTWLEARFTARHESTREEGRS